MLLYFGFHALASYSAVCFPLAVGQCIQNGLTPTWCTNCGVAGQIASHASPELRRVRSLIQRDASTGAVFQRQHRGAGFLASSSVLSAAYTATRPRIRQRSPYAATVAALMPIRRRLPPEKTSNLDSATTSLPQHLLHWHVDPSDRGWVGVGESTPDRPLPVRRSRRYPETVTSSTVMSLPTRTATQCWPRRATT